MNADESDQGLRVDVQYAAQRDDAPSVGDLRRWVGQALKGYRETSEVVVRIVDEAESAELNMLYRGKPRPTNVLSFPFEAPPQVDSDLLGDLVICADVVEREARQQGKSPNAHWAHMVVHGTLHLLGYDHQSEQEASVMEGLEREILASLGYSDPYRLSPDSDDAASDEQSLKQ